MFKANHNKKLEQYFEYSFNEHFERIVSFVYSYCRDIDIAKNIAQDSFVSFWENIEKIDIEQTALPYLYSVSKNKAINYLRRTSIIGTHKNHLTAKELELNYRALKSSTMDDIYKNNLEDLLNTCLNSMKANVRETFCLSRFANLKNEEIALKQNISVKTVEYRISCALKILRKNLSEFLSLSYLALILFFESRF